ncbi:50S ribosomal protein L4 [Pontiella sulfatireligans]|uniref:Large ribosomal subunit protein uL4 n=1 Tax=Pontiella sulfatireligans TaxID=2750658 RepID=A0A6C2UJY9_9BACT|nr:50S ribosomal protein L4 [Pontiella sulfatireligans]VGO20550.1 50S ribosomal protein L4 [Pontiella sulfatireligans]
MSKLPLKNVKGDSVGDYEFADSLLVLDRGEQAVHEAIVAYGAHQRAGTASTKSKRFVNGTGAKPWKQKGLGRARAGYKQSPVWRGGAVAHGPHPRKYTKKVSKKVGQLAFQRAFSAKVDQGEITVIDQLSVTAPKTKEFVAVLKNLGLDRGALFIVDEATDNLLLAARNIPRVELVSASLVNTYQILRYKNVIVTKAGMEALEKRLG